MTCVPRTSTVITALLALKATGLYVSPHRVLKLPER